MHRSTQGIIISLFSFLVVVGIYFHFIGSAMALVLGLSLHFLVGNPFEGKTKVYAKKVLSFSIIGLGAGLPLKSLLAYGISGIFLTFVTILLTFIVGNFLAKIMGVNRKLSALIITGTAICGGSAIAAIGPVLKSKHEEMSFALAIVFILNGIALFLFPTIGHWLEMEQEVFGLWAALAIHDTSSVVGAASTYGDVALAVGTTAKLVRALWIIPLVIFFAYLERRKGSGHLGEKAAFPHFIWGFLGMSLLFSSVPSIYYVGPYLVSISKMMLIFSLYLIGLNVSIKNLKVMGMKPIWMAIILWLVMGVFDLVIVSFVLPHL